MLSKLHDPNAALLHYGDGEYAILRQGDYVNCAVSGQKIALSDLRYWSVDLQEAYASAEISLQRYQELQSHAQTYPLTGPR